MIDCSNYDQNTETVTATCRAFQKSSRVWAKSLGNLLHPSLKESETPVGAETVNQTETEVTVETGLDKPTRRPS